MYAMLGRLSASGCLSGLLLVRDGGARIVVRAGPPGGKVVVAVEPSRLGEVVREGWGRCSGRRVPVSSYYFNDYSQVEANSVVRLRPVGNFPRNH